MGIECVEKGAVRGLGERMEIGVGDISGMSWRPGMGEVPLSLWELSLWVTQDEIPSSKGYRC